MTRSRLLLSASALGAVAVLSACGSDDTPTETTVAPTSSPSAAAPSSAATDGAAGGAAGGIQAAADVEFEDQQGAGDSATVQRVSLPGGGFVVVTVDDDDSGVADGTVLGSAAVPDGTTDAVVVPLSPALTAGTDLEATLYADTDADGGFDAAVDQRVAEPQDGDDDEDDDVSDDADYQVG